MLQLGRKLPAEVAGHIVKCERVINENKETFVVLENMKGTLLSEAVDVLSVPRVMRHCICALTGLHQASYVHFDIRPGNL